MSLLKKNIGANLVGNFWQALMAFAFVPLYIKFMGVESYGLIGVFVILQELTGFLDMGLTGTVNREMARLSVLTGREQEMRNLVRSLEIIYWSIAFFIGIIILAASPFISNYWVNAGALSILTVERALQIMGFVIALQWPLSFYAGGLMGLQHQRVLNMIDMGISTARGIGAVTVLWLISPTIQAFFLWQIFISAIHVILLTLCLWINLPLAGNRAVFQKQLLKGIWRFAAGMGAITSMSAIINQLDKIILSKMLSLEMFGYYTLAGIIAMSPLRLSKPIFSGIYPRLTQLVSLDDQDGLKRLYHKGCQLMAVLILPFAIFIAFFSYEIVLLWTQNPITAEKSHLLISILICGTALNALMFLPQALQLAFGWTKLLFLKNLLAVVLLIPLFIYMTISYGATGAASVWLILNVGYVLFEVPFMHRRLLRTEKWRWYLQDLSVPLLVALSIAGLGKLFIGSGMTQSLMLLYLIIISSLTLGLTAMVTPTTREWLFSQLPKIKST